MCVVCGCAEPAHDHEHSHATAPGHERDREHVDGRDRNSRPENELGQASRETTCSGAHGGRVAKNRESEQGNRDKGKHARIIDRRRQYLPSDSRRFQQSGIRPDELVEELVHLHGRLFFPAVEPPAEECEHAA